MQKWICLIALLASCSEGTRLPLPEVGDYVTYDLGTGIQHQYPYPFKVISVDGFVVCIEQNSVQTYLDWGKVISYSLRPDMGRRLEEMAESEQN
jgi:hypothetical protein